MAARALPKLPAWVTLVVILALWTGAALGGGLGKEVVGGGPTVTVHKAADKMENKPAAAAAASFVGSSSTSTATAAKSAGEKQQAVSAQATKQPAAAAAAAGAKSTTTATLVTPPAGTQGVAAMELNAETADVGVATAAQPAFMLGGNSGGGTHPAAASSASSSDRPPAAGRAASSSPTSEHQPGPTRAARLTTHDQRIISSSTLLQNGAIPVRKTGLIGGQSGAEFELLCPPGTFVLSFTGGAASTTIEHLSATCSDGSKLSRAGVAGDLAGGLAGKMGLRVAAGAPQPGSFSFRSTSGFNGISAHTSGVVKAVRFHSIKGGMSPVYAGQQASAAAAAADPAAGQGEQEVSSESLLACAKTEHVVGLFGRMDPGGIVALGLVCGMQPSVLDCPAGTRFVSGTDFPICFPCTAGTASSGGRQPECLKCKPGTFSDDKASHCTPCKDGYFAEGEGSTSCQKCAAGTFSDAQAGSCTACPAGTFSASSGSGRCQLCDAGSIAANPGSTACTPCAQGTFAAGQGLAACTKCSAGMYQDSQGATKCHSCKAGSFASAEGSSSCTLCQPGSMSAAEATSCSACPAGTFSSKAGSISCQLCLPGTANSATGALQCAPCPAGTSSKDAGAKSCSACAPGLYADKPGSLSCLACAPGHHSEREGAASCTACAPGSHAAKNATTKCTACPSGTYSSEAGSRSCASCTAGTYAKDGATSCTLCAAGMFSADSAGACSPCKPGTFSSSGAGSCSSCLAGSFSTEAASKCETCQPGTFAAADGAAACTPAPPGSFVASAGAKAALPCEAGFYAKTAASTACSPCPYSSFSDLTGSITCTACPQHTHTPGVPAKSLSECISDKGQTVDVHELTRNGAGSPGSSIYLGLSAMLCKWENLPAGALNMCQKNTCTTCSIFSPVPTPAEASRAIASVLPSGSAKVAPTDFRFVLRSTSPDAPQCTPPLVCTAVDELGNAAYIRYDELMRLVPEGTSNKFASVSAATADTAAASGTPPQGFLYEFTPTGYPGTTIVVQGHGPTADAPAGSTARQAWTASVEWRGMFNTVLPAAQVGIAAVSKPPAGATAYLDSSGAFRAVRSGSGAIASAAKHSTLLPLLMPVGI